MSTSKRLLLSAVIPVYNEAGGLEAFHTDLLEVLHKLCPNDYEVIYVDDGSTDHTPGLIRQWHEADHRIKLVQFSRNFGKENALSAGIAASRGQAIITLDGDGQHPAQLLPQFVAAWQAGAKVVIGIRQSNSGASRFKRSGSRLFYGIFNKLTTQKLVPGSSDYRLIDRSVQQAFLTLPETNRMTRALIDWLGFKREYIYFDSPARLSGSAGYGKAQLIKLATNSFVSLTLTPLYMFGYLGILITFAAFILGLAIFIEQILLNDPLNWNFTGTAMLGILIVFLVGIVLMSQGILSLYISHIQEQAKRRPLYIVDEAGSVGITSDKHAS